jgi:cation/acetate symporter
MASRLVADPRAYKAVVGFAAFVLVLALLEQAGLPQRWLGLIFLLATVGLLAGIGIASHARDAAEYYVAGNRETAASLGTAAGADWVSAASFIGMAGTLYLTGYGGLAFIMGWTGGYCLVALFLAPYLRKFGRFTMPDFLGARYEGDLPRVIGIAAALLCSFTYLVAQIYGVGLITARLAHVEFALGIGIALAGILACSWLGGTRALAWTSLARYLILIVAYLLPVVWLGMKQSNVPVPQFFYGHKLELISAKERQLIADPKEQQVIAVFQARADDARAKPLAGMPPHAQQFSGDPHGDPTARQAFDASRRNFLALIFCLMVGTAALPHILTRYCTTPSLKQARQSLCWSLFFIFLLCFTAPALAVLVKYEIFNVLVGTPFDQLPAWIGHWSKVDPALLSVADVNHDGIVQLGEMHIGGDIIALATPEIGGLPYVISGLVAAGSLIAAFSTADGVLMAIAHALSDDLYRRIDRHAPSARRVAVSRTLMAAVALAAALAASHKPADILFLVSAAFSFAAAAFFPALVLGIFWKRANKWGASLGMIAGLGTTLYYMVTTQPWLRGVFGITSPIELWWGIQPISAGLFGVPVGFAVMIVASLLTPAPRKETQELVEHARHPALSAAR